MTIGWDAGPWGVGQPNGAPGDGVLSALGGVALGALGGGIAEWPEGPKYCLTYCSMPETQKSPKLPGNQPKYVKFWILQYRKKFWIIRKFYKDNPEVCKFPEKNPEVHQTV